MSVQDEKPSQEVGALWIKLHADTSHLMDNLDAVRQRIDAITESAERASTALRALNEQSKGSLTKSKDL